MKSFVIDIVYENGNPLVSGTTIVLCSIECTVGTVDCLTYCKHAFYIMKIGLQFFSQFCLKVHKKIYAFIENGNIWILRLW